ncbi:MAG: hypothetical protein ACYC6A_01115 [Armatimonadota bacterium]
MHRHPRFWIPLLFLLLSYKIHADELLLIPSNLPVLEDAQYQLWVVTEQGVPQSVARFTVRPSDRSLITPQGDPLGNPRTPFPVRNGQTMLLTIEQAGDADESPSPVKFLHGRVQGERVELTMGVDFSKAAGKYLLETPTDEDTTNALSGIWFLKHIHSQHTELTPASGLFLPPLPSGWLYEGWVVVNGQPLSTGQFPHPFRWYVVGNDLSATFSGPRVSPPFPGEDFVTNAPAGVTFPLNLQGAMTRITLEPVPDPSPAPSGIEILTATISADAQPNTVYVMANPFFRRPILRIDRLQ